jgi:GNAT superfamily N-acetyltransferase
VGAHGAEPRGRRLPGGRISDLLDNPIWNALTTVQAPLAESAGDAARFPPAMTALGGLRVAGDASFATLAALIAPGEICGVLLDRPLTPPPRLTVLDAPRVLQMVHEGAPPPEAGTFEQLGPDDSPAMVALAEATRPGPFGARTHELGVFLGIRDERGRVIAMAGQRMRLPGLIEISGVCTDPAHLGRGHAARLMTAQLARIAADGCGTFLHVKDDNARAIAVYERLGFRARRRFEYLVVRCRT